MDLPTFKVREMRTVHIIEVVATAAYGGVVAQSLILMDFSRSDFIYPHLSILFFQGSAFLAALWSLLLFKKQYRISKRLLYIAAFLNSIHSTLFYSNYTATNYALIIIIVFIFITFDKSERHIQLIFLFIFTLLFVFNEIHFKFTHKSFYRFLFNVDVSKIGYYFYPTFFINFTFATSGIIISLNYFIKTTHSLEGDLLKSTKKVDMLLHNVFPETIVNRLFLSQKTEDLRWEHSRVSVFFADITNFTKSIKSIPPKQLLTELDYIYNNFDNIAKKFEVVKIKTIGDGYLAICGAPDPVENNELRMISFAIEIINFINDYKKKSLIQGLNVRIGIDTGPIISGVVGNSRQVYDIWGNTVNKASRLESNGVPGRIQVSQAVYEKCIESFKFEKTSAKMKGIGVESTYLI